MRLHPYVRITGWPSLNGRHDVIRRLGQEGMDEICLPSMEWPLRAASIRPVDQAKGRERPQWVGRVEPAGRTIRWQMSIMGQPATTPPGLVFLRLQTCLAAKSTFSVRQAPFSAHPSRQR